MGFFFQIFFFGLSNREITKFMYLPTCRIPSEVCKSGGEPAVNLVQSQLTLGRFNHGLKTFGFEKFFELKKFYFALEFG